MTTAPHFQSLLDSQQFNFAIIFKTQNILKSYTVYFSVIMLLAVDPDWQNQSHT